MVKPKPPPSPRPPPKPPDTLVLGMDGLGE